MKKKLLSIVYGITLTCYAINSNAQANQKLSNLTSPTAVNQSLLPGTNNTINLGSISQRWKNIHLGNALYLKGSLTLHTPGTANFFAGGFAGNVLVTGIANTGAGQSALNRLTSGYSNTASGYVSLYSNTTGYANTAAGAYALYANISGTANTANGYGAGAHGSNKTNCTFIGFDADQSVTITLTNSTALGSLSSITASNQVRIGNSSVTSIGGYEPWTNLSDGRFKKHKRKRTRISLYQSTARYYLYNRCNQLRKVFA